MMGVAIRMADLRPAGSLIQDTTLYPLRQFIVDGGLLANARRGKTDMPRVLSIADRSPQQAETAAIALEADPDQRCWLAAADRIRRHD
jgi:hypothetical protein